MRRLWPLLLLCACKTTSSSETHAEETAQATLDTGQHVETRVEEAPDRVTTTVREYGPPPVRKGRRSAAGEAPTLPTTPESDSGSVVAAPDTVPDRGPLVKETVTVEEKGAVTTTTEADRTTQATTQSTAAVTEKHSRTWDVLHSPFTWIGALVAVAAVIGVVWKIRKAAVP